MLRHVIEDWWRRTLLTHWDSLQSEFPVSPCLVRQLLARTCPLGACDCCNIAAILLSKFRYLSKALLACRALPEILLPSCWHAMVAELQHVSQTPQPMRVAVLSALSVQAGVLAGIESTFDQLAKSCPAWR